MAEELEVTLEALEALYRERREQGWTLTVYDYGENRWFAAEEAFARDGTYELAVLTDPRGERVRVRLRPSGGRGVLVDSASAGEMAVWRAMGLELGGPAIALLRKLMEGRSGPVTLEELDSMLASASSEGGDEASVAASLRRSLATLMGERTKGGRRQ